MSHPSTTFASMRKLLVVSAVVAVLCAPEGADALTTTHLDAFGVAVADRLAALPETGLDATQARQRKALLKASNALAAETVTAAKDLAAATKAAKAVQTVFAEDAPLLAALDAGLDSYRADADAQLTSDFALVQDGPLGRSRSKIEAKLNQAAAALVKADTAEKRSTRAKQLGKAAKALASARAGLYDGDCPRYDGVYRGELGTVTYVVDGETHVAQDIDVSVWVDSDSGALLDVIFVARWTGTGSDDETLTVGLYESLVTGAGTYTDPIPAGPGRWGYTFAGAQSFVGQGFSGSVTFDEFSYEPVEEDAFVGAWGAGYKSGRGRLRGSFDLTFCTTIGYPGPTCGGASKHLVGTFELCNPTIQEW